MVIKKTVLIACAIAAYLSMGCTEKNPLVAVPLKVNHGIIATIMDPTGTSGNMGVLDLQTMEKHADLLPVNSDAVAKPYSKSVYILERFGKDNLIKLTGASLAVSYQKRLGVGTNVQDIAFVSDTKAYVTQLQSPNLLIVNPTTGDTTGHISLRAFGTTTGTSSDSLPYMSPIVVSDGFAYVGCQRLDGSSFLPVDTSLIIKVSVLTDSVVSVIPLLHANPTALSAFGGRLYVVCTGSYLDTADGAIDRIDLTTGTVDALFGDAVTGGSIGQSIVFVDATHAYVTSVRDAMNWTGSYTVVVMFNPSTGAITKTLSGVDNAFGGMATDGTRLFVGDQSKDTPGIVVFDGVTGDKISGPYNVGVNPMSLAYFDFR